MIYVNHMYNKSIEMEKYPKKVIDIISPEARLLEEDVVLPAFAKNVADKQAKAEHGENGIESIINDIVAEPMSDKDVMEALLNAEHDPIAELVKAGATVGKTGKWQGNLKTKDGTIMEVELPYGSSTSIYEQEFYDQIIAKIREPLSPRVAVLVSSVKKPASIWPIEARPRLQSRSRLDSNLASEAKAQLGRIVYENQITDFYKVPAISKSTMSAKADFVDKKRNFNFAPPKKKNYSTLFFIILGIFGVFAYGATLKHELIRDSSLAIENLGKAGNDLKNFDFNSAAGNFRKSYEDLSGASRNLNLAGAGLAGIFADLPGFNTLTAGGAGKLKSAKDIVEAGKFLAGAGEAMSEAMGALSQTGAILNPNDGNKTKPLRIIGQLKDALALSAKNLGKAKALLAGVDESIIPEDKLETFHDFKDKMPMFEELLSDSQEYVDFLEGIIGIDESKKYLLLFNNYSELRPTGGFPGTYGVISFSNGGLENFFVDDVYNLDGQLKENIIPPKPLQHITPTLGMRDSSWFIDFPASARKAMSFFAREAGHKVDGVIALNPDVISQVLDAVGPIKMPEYGLTLTADNFLESIQEEVEYGDNRAQPKKVVVDLAPRLLAKLYSATPEQWIKIFNSWMTSLEEKDILFYLDNKGLEEFAVKKGFGGEVKDVVGDYLAINFSNIKGSKTDAVTDSSVSIDTRFDPTLIKRISDDSCQGQSLDKCGVEDGRIIHKVVITRTHKGGDHEHGFYNRQNPAYVRLLLPENVEFLSISGNDTPNFKPLVSYFGSGFSEDRDIKVLESTIYHDPALNIDVYEESGKKGIGFWMLTEPGTTKKVEFEYRVPLSDRGTLSGLSGSTNDYSFYFQKQPGVDWKNFKFKLNSSKDYAIIEIMPEFNKIGDMYLFDEVLKKDFEMNIKFKKQ